MRIAITRGVSSNIDRCELTHIGREIIDVALARSQHESYERELVNFGCRIDRLEAQEDFPDSVFVEDIALVLPEVAIMTRPGAESRRGERPGIETALAPHRRVNEIVAPAILDGGDIIVAGTNIYVGMSSRSNSEAVRQLRGIVSDDGYRVIEVEFQGCLHLKSAATAIGSDVILMNPDWVKPETFETMRCINIDPNEPNAANAIRIDDTVLVGADFPKTAELLTAQGFEVLAVESSELAKAEGALTCCSLIFDVPDAD